MATSDPTEIKMELARYKDHGMVSYRKVLEIPMAERIPALVADLAGRRHIAMLLSAALQGAFSNMNLRFAFNDEQLVELADMIIDSSHEDHLGLEDVLLFLGDMLTGKSGKIYDRLDIPTFFELFETYRQRRHLEIKAIRDEEEVQFKALPINDRFVHDSVNEEKDKSRKALLSYLPPNPNHDTRPENETPL